ncbi:MAG: response regulator [Sphingomonadaceae bacterium]|nr:response regulator [Sphingomonadaceae bacterium]
MADNVHPISDESTGREIWWRGLASVGALLATLLFGALIYLVAQSNSDRDTAAERERQSFETIVLARSVDRAIARSEAALGRFVISSDRSLGTVFRTEWRTAGRQITQLQRLVRDSGEQSALARQLETQYRGYGDELANTANYAATGRNWEALSLHNMAAQSEYGPAISRTIAAIAENERAVLGARSSDRIAATERSNLLAQLLVIAGLILGTAAIGFGWMTIRAFRDRHNAYRRAEDLEDAVAARTSELETLNAELRAEATERAVIEQRLRQAHKMEAVGRLTGGIAHDFNNMLSVVVGGLDLARRKIKAGKTDVVRHLDSAADGADRAAALTRRLLAFARAEPLLPESTDAVKLVSEMEDLLQRTIGESIEVVVEPGEDVSMIWVDPRQLENAILNLAVNARDAMEGKGILTISATNVVLATNEIGDASAGEYVRIAVSDEGSGMAPEVMEHVFEPFFTTKPVGKGTGLGLSQIFGFARQSGGEVGIDTEVGVGTTVSLYLPAHEGEASEADNSADSWRADMPAKPLKNRIIMVVEDDERVRQATIEAVKELGGETDPYSNGQAALKALEQRQDIDLLLTDVVMPGMTGVELADMVETLYPELPIVFVTGYVGEAGDSDQLSGKIVLHKPFTMAQLVDALTSALDGLQGARIAAE